MFTTGEMEMVYLKMGDTVSNGHVSSENQARNHWMWVMSDRLFRQTQMQTVRGYRVASCRHTSISEPSSRSLSSSISSSRAWPEFQRIVSDNPQDVKDG